MAIQIFVDGWNEGKPLGRLPLPEIDGVLDIVGWSEEGLPIMTEPPPGTAIHLFRCEPPADEE